MTHSYFVRITHPWRVARPVIETWQWSCHRMIVYEHTGELSGKEHIHVVIEGSEHQKKWLRELGKRQGVDLTGNGNCSFKEYDGDKTAMVYSSKGKHDPVYNKGYDPADVALWKSQYVPSQTMSKAETLYMDAFGDDEYMETHFNGWKEDYRQDPRNPLIDAQLRFIWLKRTAYNHALLINRYVVSLKTINDYKMLVYTYIARHTPGFVLIPDDDPVFKRFG